MCCLQEDCNSVFLKRRNYVSEEGNCYKIVAIVNFF
jgi:hypothetical protein